jgi:DNA-binding CsgD family transcriptional regulator
MTREEYNATYTFEDFTMIEMDEVEEYWKEGFKSIKEIARETMISEENVRQILDCLSIKDKQYAKYEE